MGEEEESLTLFPSHLLESSPLLLASSSSSFSTSSSSVHPTNAPIFPQLAPPPPPPATPTRPSNLTLYHPTLAEIEGDQITSLASSHWLVDPISLTSKEPHSSKASVQPSLMTPLIADDSLIQGIWKTHLEGTGFSLRKVMLLEFSQYLEKVGLVKKAALR